MANTSTNEEREREKGDEREIEGSKYNKVLRFFFCCKKRRGSGGRGQRKT
jgi:hypothetical protein